LGKVRVGLEAKIKIDRNDFGLTWNTALETGEILVGDTVHITIEAELIKG
jgi:polyisoprenoid-binding protein YceI